jgi:hypothetical protein
VCPHLCNSIGRVRYIQIASSRLKSPTTLPHLHLPHRLQKLLNPRNPYSPVRGRRLSMRRNTIGMAPNSSLKKSASRRVFRKRFSRVKPSRVVSGDRYVVVTWKGSTTDDCTASTNDYGLITSDSVRCLHHSSFHGVPTPCRAETLS